MSNIYEDFAHLVIERIHGKSYKEAIDIESRDRNCLALYSHNSEDILIRPVYCEIDEVKMGYSFQEYIGFPITISRVIQSLREDCANNYAIGEEGELMTWCYNDDKFPEESTYSECGIKWKLIKKNGQECDHTDQSEDTILKLTNLIK